VRAGEARRGARQQIERLVPPPGEREKCRVTCDERRVGPAPERARSEIELRLEIAAIESERPVEPWRDLDAERTLLRRAQNVGGFVDLGVSRKRSPRSRHPGAVEAQVIDESPAAQQGERCTGDEDPRPQDCAAREERASRGDSREQDNKQQDVRVPERVFDERVQADRARCGGDPPVGEFGGPPQPGTDVEPPA